MRQTSNLTGEFAREVLNDLLSVNHGWWCDTIEEYSIGGQTRQKLANRPYFSPEFLRMYDYSAEEMSPQAIFRDRETRRTVIREIREVIRPGSKAQSGRIVAYTKSGEKKLVEAYLRRIERPDGTALLASLHSDLTISTDVQWIERNVLDKLQAFVFVKRWDSARQKFIFTYMNENLARVLKTKPPTASDGLADDDFFEDEAQIRTFREADQIIRDADDPDLVIMREETFDPQTKATLTECSQPAIPRRLLTFKTPLSIPSRGPAKGRWEVLGIAIDVSSVTDVLRSIADNSDNGLYIKDAQRRYQYVNKKFLELLQAPGERQVLDRTFAEALRELRKLGTGPKETAVDHLNHLIEIEDAKVFAGAQSTVLRELALPNATDWLTQKFPIWSQDGKVTHLLGLTSPLFPGRLGEILNKLPQCISVKRYYPTERDQPGEFKLVWANRSYLDIHEKKELVDVIGSTDADLWPDHPEQVAQFRRHDRLVVERYQMLRSDPGWAGLSSGERWVRVAADCQACGCWEYRETTRSKTQTRVLQTTKWVEAVEGSETLYVVVVYSDVTKGDVEQQRYHEMTVHSLRGATSPNATAGIHLRRILEGADNVDTRLRAAIACLDDASRAVDLFLLHHLKLLKMNVECRPTDLNDVIATLQVEGKKLERSWGIAVDIDAGWPGAALSCDLTLLQFVLNELLLNAAKATHRRGETADAKRTPYVPSVSVRFTSSGDELRCVIGDNGVASSDAGERAELVRSFDAARVNPFNRNSRSFGLSFCFVALRAQGGRIELGPQTDWTNVEVCLPISKRTGKL